MLRKCINPECKSECPKYNDMRCCIDCEGITHCVCSDLMASGKCAGGCMVEDKTESEVKV